MLYKALVNRLAVPAETATKSEFTFHVINTNFSFRYNRETMIFDILRIDKVMNSFFIPNMTQEQFKKECKIAQLESIFTCFSKN